MVLNFVESKLRRIQGGNTEISQVLGGFFGKGSSGKVLARKQTSGIDRARRDLLGKLIGFVGKIC